MKANQVRSVTLQPHIDIRIQERIKTQVDIRIHPPILVLVANK
jgi:hypothetical protein